MRKLRRIFNKNGSIRKIVYPDGTHRYWWDGVETDLDFYRRAVYAKFKSSRRLFPNTTELAALRNEIAAENIRVLGRRVATEAAIVMPGGIVRVQLPPPPIGSMLTTGIDGSLVVWNPSMRSTIIGTVMSSAGGWAVIQLNSQTAQVVVDPNNRNLAHIRAIS